MEPVLPAVVVIEPAVAVNETLLPAVPRSPLVRSRARSPMVEMPTSPVMAPEVVSVSELLFLRNSPPPAAVRLVTEVARGLLAVPMPFVADRESVPVARPDSVALFALALFPDAAALLTLVVL